MTNDKHQKRKKGLQAPQTYTRNIKGSITPNPNILTRTSPIISSTTYDHIHLKSTLQTYIASTKELIKKKFEQFFNSNITPTESSSFFFHPKKNSGKIRSKDVKRLETLEEFILTELSHIRQLSLLEDYFLKPLEQYNILNAEYLKELFPNLDQLILLHKNLLDNIVNELSQGNIYGIMACVCEIFHGIYFDKFMYTVTNFCKRQNITLRKLKIWRALDIQLDTFFIHAEKSNQLDRLKFTDLIACSHQRLTKYQLFFNQLLNFTPPSHEDFENLKLSLVGSKMILNHVNHAIEIEENSEKLKHINNHLKVDQCPIEIYITLKEFHLQDQQLLLDSNIFLETENEKTMEFYCIITNKYFVILNNEKGYYYLKPFKLTYSKGLFKPIIVLEDIISVKKYGKEKSFCLIIQENNEQPYMLMMYCSSSILCQKLISKLNGIIEHEAKKKKTLSTVPPSTSKISDDSSSIQDNNSMENIIIENITQPYPQLYSLLKKALLSDSMDVMKKNVALCIDIIQSNRPLMENAKYTSTSNDTSLKNVSFKETII